MQRRSFLQTATLLVGSTASPSFEPWRPGTLDIHHLAYGRGNSTFILGPDGSTLLIDAGTTEDALAVSAAQRPNASVRPGEWIASYVRRQMLAAGRRELDYFLLSHLHPDHVGDLGPENPLSTRGDYRLTGLMDVAARVRIDRVIDRGFPDYRYPSFPQAPFALNYLSYIEARRRSGEACERAQVGRADQIRLRHNPEPYPHFAVRTVCANGEVWTGTGTATRSCFPPLSGLGPEELPTENMCSIAVRVSLGKFDYYTGGDLPCDTEESGLPWHDIEKPAAQAAGPVDVAVANHHGYFDSVGPDFVRFLQPQVFIIPAWYVAHPSVVPLRHMLSRRLYAGDRDVFATNVMTANREVNNQFISKVKSVEGHVVIRVAAAGDTFRVVIVDNADDRGRVKAVFGPYRCI